MLRENFFYQFFKSKKDISHQIVGYNANSKYELQKQINIKISKIDQEISEISKALFEAKIINLKYNISKSNNFINKLEKQFYKEKLESSIDWHQEKLKELYITRKVLQVRQSKIQGIYWIIQFKRLLKILLIGFFIVFNIILFLSGFMIIVSLLPIIILIILGYLILSKK